MPSHFFVSSTCKARTNGKNSISTVVCLTANFLSLSVEVLGRVVCVWYFCTKHISVKRKPASGPTTCATNAEKQV